MADSPFGATPVKVVTAVRYGMHGDLIDLDKEIHVYPSLATTKHVPYLDAELLYEGSLTSDPACVARAIRDDSRESLEIDRSGAIQFALDNLPKYACGFVLYEVISVGLTEPTVPAIALVSTPRNRVHYVANPLIGYANDVRALDWNHSEYHELRETVGSLRGEALHHWMSENRRHVICTQHRRTCFDGNAQFVWSA